MPIIIFFLVNIQSAAGLQEIFLLFLQFFCHHTQRFFLIVDKTSSRCGLYLLRVLPRGDSKTLTALFIWVIALERSQRCQQSQRIANSFQLPFGTSVEKRWHFFHGLRDQLILRIRIFDLQVASCINFLNCRRREDGISTFWAEWKNQKSSKSATKKLAISHVAHCICSWKHR